MSDLKFQNQKKILAKQFDLVAKIPMPNLLLINQESLSTKNKPKYIHDVIDEYHGYQTLAHTVQKVNHKKMFVNKDYSKSYGRRASSGILKKMRKRS